MARQARIKSETGIYHVMLRGNERKPVFLDEEDKSKFLEVVLRKKEAAVSRLFAYCVMDNHVHLVIQELENGQPLDTLMKRIGVSYAIYFNKKYKREGHVFQDRFRSEAIEEESYLLSVIRYVHQNPVKAKIVDGLNYRWSSYNIYIGKKGNMSLLPEMEEVLSQFSVDKRSSVRNFIEYHQAEDNNAFIDVPASNVENAKDILDDFLQRQSLSLDDLNKRENIDKASEIIEKLVCETGMSGRQAAEMVGINREKVRRILVSKEPSDRVKNRFNIRANSPDVSLNQ